MAAVVRNATKADAGALGDLLGRAFASDPLWSWIYPQADRSRRLARMFRMLTQVTLDLGGTVLTDRETRAAALWMPHDKTKFRLRDNVRMGFAMITSGANMRRGRKALNEIDRRHPKEPHWYLSVLGTDPEHQGKGLGGTLVKQVIDRPGTNAYLETETPANVAYYRQFGFEVVDECDIGGDGPHLWFMWRDAT